MKRDGVAGGITPIVTIASHDLNTPALNSSWVAIYDYSGSDVT